MREACGGCVSSAQHRSDSAARSTPTRALARDTPILILLFIINHLILLS
ncbi:MAG: hypothetical protein NZ455_00480 [Bacteroidia bacterium]|nr:hypothetical protein [Bacteroidia bacterium]